MKMKNVTEEWEIWNKEKEVVNFKEKAKNLDISFSKIS